MAGNINLGTIEAVLKASGFNEFSKELKTTEGRMKDFSKSLKSVGDSMTKTGQTLSRNVTLPIVAVSTAALKLAADFEVSGRKFATAFRDSGSEASSAVEDLNENFGLASSTATQLLANTGDILRGFGATSSEALILSENVQELAASLSAYNGVPVAQTSRSITSALTGERESLKQLGVVIRDVDVQQRLLQNGQSELVGEALLLAQAQATLELAIEQSGDAVASFASNQDTLSFQTQKLAGDTKDLAIQFGQQLLPIAKDLVEEMTGLVERFSALDDGQKEGIIRTAALAAAIGPALVAVGSLTKAVGALSVAFTFLAANPAVAVVAAIAAIGTAIAVAGIKNHREGIEQLTEKYGDLAVATGVAADELRSWVQEAEFVEQALNRNDMFVTFESVNDQVRALTANTELTKEQIIQIGLESESLTDVFKEQLVIIEENRRLSEALSQEYTLQEHAMIRQAAAQAESEEIAEQRRVEEERITAQLTQQEELRLRVEERYLDARGEVLSILESEVGEYEQLEQTIARLNQTPWGAGGQLEADRLAAVEVLRSRQKEILAQEESEALARQAREQQKIQSEIQMARDAAKEIEAIEQEALNNIARLSDNREYILEQEYMSRIELAQEAGASTLAIEEEFNIRRRNLAEQRTAEEREQSARRVEIIKNQYQQIEGLIFEYTNSFSQIKSLEADLARQESQEFLASNREEIAALEKKADTEEGLTAEEKDRLNSLNKEKKKLLKEQHKQEVEAFNSQKAIRIAQAIISGAQAAISAFNALAAIPIVGPVLATAAAAAAIGFTAAQVDLMRQQQPPSPPKLAQGGLIPQTPGGVQAIIGEGKSDEVVLPLTDKTFNDLGQAIIESQQGSVVDKSLGLGSLTVVIEGLGSIVVDDIQDRLNNNVIRVPGSAIIQGA